MSLFGFLAAPLSIHLPRSPISWIGPVVRHRGIPDMRMAAERHIPSSGGGDSNGMMCVRCAPGERSPSRPDPKGREAGYRRSLVLPRLIQQPLEFLISEVSGPERQPTFGQGR